MPLKLLIMVVITVLQLQIMGDTQSRQTAGEMFYVSTSMDEARVCCSSQLFQPHLFCLLRCQTQAPDISSSSGEKSLDNVTQKKELKVTKHLRKHFLFDINCTDDIYFD